LFKEKGFEFRVKLMNYEMYLFQEASQDVIKEELEDVFQEASQDVIKEELEDVYQEALSEEL